MQLNFFQSVCLILKLWKRAANRKRLLFCTYGQFWRMFFKRDMGWERCLLLCIQSPKNDISFCRKLVCRIQRASPRFICVNKNIHVLKIISGPFQFGSMVAQNTTCPPLTTWRDGLLEARVFCKSRAADFDTNEILCQQLNCHKDAVCQV